MSALEESLKEIQKRVGHEYVTFDEFVCAIDGDKRQKFMPVGESIYGLAIARSLTGVNWDLVGTVGFIWDTLVPVLIIASLQIVVLAYPLADSVKYSLTQHSTVLNEGVN